MNMYSFLLKIKYSTVGMIIVISLILIAIASTAVYGSYFLINNDNKNQAIIDAQNITNEINMAIDGFSKTINTAISESKNSPCDEKLEGKLKQTSWTDTFQGLTILKNGHIFCSTFFEASQTKLEPILHDQTKNILNLFESQLLKDKRLLMTYKVEQDIWTGFITIRITNFLEGLKFINFPRQTYFSINNKMVNNNDSLKILNTNTINNQWFVFKSDKYPFQIAVDLPAIKISTAAVIFLIILTLGLFILYILIISYIIKTAKQRRLKKAIYTNELTPYYQLIFSTETQKWSGIEVLTRWLHPKQGLIMPSYFISLAEESKLIIPLTKKLMQKVASELSPHIDKLPKPFNIAFNIHPSHLQEKDLVEDCKNFLATFPPNLVSLTLEICESQFVESSNNLDTLITELRKTGISIAIDDFGTGYSNLGYLKKYKINYLKIDKLFVSEIEGKNHDNHLLNCIINMAIKMKMSIVAEGVETLEQLCYLAQKGVNNIQGFLFNKPLPINDMVALLNIPKNIIKISNIARAARYIKPVKSMKPSKPNLRDIQKLACKPYKTY